MFVLDKFEFGWAEVWCAALSVRWRVRMLHILPLLIPTLAALAAEAHGSPMNLLYCHCPSYMRPDLSTSLP